MLLFHASKLEIPKPDIHHGRKNADFGWGFYLTPDREFAHRWSRAGWVVNKYEFDDEGLDICRLTRNAEWFEYIFHNRRMKDSLAGDVIVGPIANDTIFDTLGIISSGFLNENQAMELLMIGPEYTQVAIKSEKAAERLKWIGADQAELPDTESLDMERKKYQEQFGAVLERLVEE